MFMPLLNDYTKRITGIIQEESAWLPDRAKDWSDPDKERMIRVMLAIALRSSGQDKGLMEDMLKTKEI